MMKYEGHTPGPWEDIDGTIYGDDGYCIANTVPYNPNEIGIDAEYCERTDNANARLIADAPALLELVQMCLEYFEDPDHTPVQLYELERKIREALDE